jgi:hypothetical protein
MYITRCYCPILMKLEFCRRNLEKYCHITFHYNPSTGSGVSCGQTGRQTDIPTERHDEAKSRFPQFCERA